MPVSPSHYKQQPSYFALAILLASLIFWSHNSRAECAAIFEHSMRKLHSQQQIDICQLTRGKPTLVINTASHCGYTPQFKGLETLHQRFKKKGLVVVGFASNDFNQESNSEAKAANICYVNYGVSFTMIAPTHVTGEHANPVFQALNHLSRPPSWNFNKYLVDKSGQVIKHFDSSVKPEDTKLIAAIEAAL